MKKNTPLFAVFAVGILIFSVEYFDFFSSDDDLSRHAPLEPPPYETVRFPTLEHGGDASCEELLTKDMAFPAYKVALESLTGGTPAAEVPFLDCFLTGWETSPDVETLRRRFVGEVFLPEVLYGYLARKFESTLALSLKTGVTKHWRIGRYGEAALLAYQRTGDRAFIDLYINFFDRQMMLRDSQLDYYDKWHERIMDSWGSYNLENDHSNPWVSHITHFSLVMLPATGFAREILANPDLSEYREWADATIRFFDRAYPQFDVDLRSVMGTNEHWYWRPVVEKFEPLNHIHIHGQMLLNMYAISGKPIFAERIETILRVFEKSMTINEDGLASWNYSPYFQVDEAKNEKNSTLYSEPTWKGSITVPFLYQAAQDGFTMSDGVLDAVTRSITEYILADATPKLYTHPKESRSVTNQEITKVNKLRKSPRASDLLKEPELVEVMKLENNFAGFYYAVILAPEVSQQIKDYVANNPEMLPEAWFSNHASAPGYAMSISPF